MAIFFPPPPPIVAANAAQPYAQSRLPPSIEAVPVNEPPYSTAGGPYASKLEIAYLAQPDPWTYTFTGGCQPFEPRKLSPGIPGQSVDKPPPSHDGRTVEFIATIVQMLQPDPWVYDLAGSRQPYDFRKLSPGTPGQSIDLPPPSHRERIALSAVVVAQSQPPAWPFVSIGGAQPYAQLRMSSGIPGQSVDKPQFNRRRFISLAAQINLAWQPPDPQPWNRFPAYRIKFAITFTQGFIIG